MNLPSDISGEFPWSSVFKNAEREIIAKNIVVILKRNGNTWRKLPYEEYVAERQKDGHFSESEKSYFDDVIDYTVSAEAAASFSKYWAIKFVFDAK